MSSCAFCRRRDRRAFEVQGHVSLCCAPCAVRIARICLEADEETRASAWELPPPLPLDYAAREALDDLRDLARDVDPTTRAELAVAYADMGFVRDGVLEAARSIVQGNGDVPERVLAVLLEAVTADGVRVLRERLSVS